MLTVQGPLVSTTSLRVNTQRAEPYVRARIQWGSDRRPMWADTYIYANPRSRDGESVEAAKERAIGEVNALADMLRAFKSVIVHLYANQVHEVSYDRNDGSKAVELQFHTNLSQVTGWNNTKREWVPLLLATEGVEIRQRSERVAAAPRTAAVPARPATLGAAAQAATVMTEKVEATIDEPPFDLATHLEAIGAPLFTEKEEVA
jgi:hypothetical protein